MDETIDEPFFDEATKRKMVVSSGQAFALSKKLVVVRAKRLLREGKSSGMKPEEEVSVASDVATQILSQHSPAGSKAQGVVQSRARDEDLRMPVRMPDDYGLEADDDATSIFLDAHVIDLGPAVSRSSSKQDQFAVEDNGGEGESASASPGELDFLDDWGSDKSEASIDLHPVVSRYDEKDDEMSHLLRDSDGESDDDQGKAGDEGAVLSPGPVHCSRSGESELDAFISSLDDDDLYAKPVKTDQIKKQAGRHENEMSSDFEKLLKEVRARG